MKTMEDFEKELYKPRTAQEAQALTDKYAKGFSEGYHRGLKEGYITARYPERCHCCHCRSHGELCSRPRTPECGGKDCAASILCNP